MKRVSRLISLLFPPRCVFCKRVIGGSGKNGVCPSCESELKHCALRTRHPDDSFSLCASPLVYEGKVREALHRYKFSGRSAYAEVFGKLMAECVAEHLAGKYDLISWVPLSAERLKKRGYDQAMLLAMACALELDDVAAETLIKHRDVPAQSSVGGRAERRENISGVYGVSDPELVADRRILLIDDIITTGSTISECARELRRAGARDVICATLARARD